MVTSYRVANELCRDKVSARAFTNREKKANEEENTELRWRNDTRVKAANVFKRNGTTCERTTECVTNNSKINVMCHNYIGSDTHAHVFAHGGWSFYNSFYPLCAVSRCMPFCLTNKKESRTAVLACISVAETTRFAECRLSLARFSSLSRVCVYNNYLLFSSRSRSLVHSTHSSMLSRCIWKQCNRIITIFARKQRKRRRRTTKKKQIENSQQLVNIEKACACTLVKCTLYSARSAHTYSFVVGCV